MLGSYSLHVTTPFTKRNVFTKFLTAFIYQFRLESEVSCLVMSCKFQAQSFVNKTTTKRKSFAQYIRVSYSWFVTQSL